MEMFHGMNCIISIALNEIYVLFLGGGIVSFCIICTTTAFQKLEGKRSKKVKIETCGVGQITRQYL